jgi:uncharacterized protein (TIGR00730 family)
MLSSRPFVAVFCGARTGVSSRHADEAAELGRSIGRLGAGLVYGGGRVGLMGILADAALEAGAPVYGVIPAGLAKKEVAHAGLTRLDVVATMHERKARISDAARGFIAMAGGFGTLDELFEVVTWKQLGHHDRPIVLLNGSGFFDPLLLAVSHMTSEGFIPEGHAIFSVEELPHAAVQRALDLGGNGGSSPRK